MKTLCIIFQAWTQEHRSLTWKASGETCPPGTRLGAQTVCGSFWRDFQGKTQGPSGQWALGHIYIPSLRLFIPGAPYLRTWAGRLPKPLCRGKRRNPWRHFPILTQYSTSPSSFTLLSSHLSLIKWLKPSVQGLRQHWIDPLVCVSTSPLTRALFPREEGKGSTHFLWF